MGVWANQIAVVTGGSSGIGFSLAQRLASEGMDIAIAATNKVKLDNAAEKLRQSSGREVAAYVCDVADRKQVQVLAESVKDRFGQVDLLCANAGATTIGTYLDHHSADWDWSLDLNLRGATNCVEAFYPDMAARGSGTILFTGSQVALFPDWVLGHGPYTPAKAAMLALAFALRHEAAEMGVKVSILLAGGTETAVVDSARHVPPDGGEITFRDDLPKPHPPLLISPDEVAARTVAGLKANAPLIVTHAGMRPLVENYFDRILAAYDNAAAWRAEES